MKRIFVFVARLFGATAMLSAFLSISVPVAQAIGAEITLNAPSNGQIVSGKVSVGVTLGPDVYWNQVRVDGISVWAGTGNCTWNSTTVANGTHTLKVRAFQKGRDRSGRYHVGVRRGQQPVRSAETFLDAALSSDIAERFAVHDLGKGASDRGARSS